MTEDLKDLLQLFRAKGFEKKVKYFRNLDFKTITSKELAFEFLKVISVKKNGLYQSILLTRINQYYSNTRFYRLRKIENGDLSFPLKEMKVERDAWCPPPEIVIKRGRLNKINESLLYTSPNPNTTISELSISEGQHFCLIIYEAVKSIKVNMVGIWEDSTELSEKENHKMRLVNNFIKEEFTRKVKAKNEYLYKITETIIKDYFDLPPNTQDAWCYPSVALNTEVNVCFRPDNANKLLRLVGVKICTIERGNSSLRFNNLGYLYGFNDNQIFNYYPHDYDDENLLFPEFKKG